MDEICIYGLVDPRDDRVRYVGQTKSVSRRWYEHMRYPLGSEKRKWVFELRALGLRPCFHVFERTTEENCDAREKYWIAHFGGLEKLLNVAPGGRRNFDYATVAAKQRLRKRPDSAARLKKLWAEQGESWRRKEGVVERLRSATKRQFSDPVRREKHHVAMKRWAAANPSACSKGGKAAAQTPGFVAARETFWSEMTPEQREDFRKRRAAIQGSERNVTEEFIANCKQAQKSAWSDESVRSARIAGIKAAWADPARRAARIEKNRLARTN